MGTNRDDFLAGDDIGYIVVEFDTTVIVPKQKIPNLDQVPVYGMSMQPNGIAGANIFTTRWFIGGNPVGFPAVNATWAFRDEDGKPQGVIAEWEFQASVAVAGSRVALVFYTRPHLIRLI